MVKQKAKISKKLAHELEAKYIFCDVSNRNAVFRVVSNLLKEIPKIDVLVNAAGIVRPKPFLKLKEEDWFQEFKTNVLGTVYFCQAVIPYMLKQKCGRIVNIASIRGYPSMANNRTLPYSISKAAVINLTSALAKEFAPHIAINAVAPGFTKTDMAKTWNFKTRLQVKN